MRTLEDLENGYFLYQEKEGFRFGIDAVLLAHYPSLRNGDRICDFCTGSGVIPHILQARLRDSGKNAFVEAMELDPAAAACARDSVRYNHLEDRIHIVRKDVREAAAVYGAASFSLVTCNPPYFKAGGGLRAKDPARDAARSELNGTFREIAHGASQVLKMRGRFALVHRPERLQEILRILWEEHLTVKRLRMVHSRPEKAAVLFLAEAVKGGGEGMKTEPPLIVYDGDGAYTKEILSLYGREP